MSRRYAADVTIHQATNDLISKKKKTQASHAPKLLQQGTEGRRQIRIERRQVTALGKIRLSRTIHSFCPFQLITYANTRATHSSFVLFCTQCHLSIHLPIHRQTFKPSKTSSVHPPPIEIPSSPRHTTSPIIFIHIPPSLLMVHRRRSLVLIVHRLRRTGVARIVLRWRRLVLLLLLIERMRHVLNRCRSRVDGD
jgi:hypothetical protein